MMALMHVAEPSGSLLVKGKRPDRKQLASLAGISEKECTALLLELEGMAVFSRDENGTIYSRRMRRDAERAEEDKKNGKNGGNPKLKGGVNPPDKAQMPETRIDVADDASPRGGSLVTPEALALTEKLLVIAGHDPAFWPPGWCGAPMRVQTWTDQGWKPEIIVAAVTSVAARKHGAPANSINFFERAIAEEHAKQAAPLPKVEIREQQTITVNHGTSKSKSGGSLLDSINRERANVEAQIADLALPGNAVLSIPDRSVRRP
jgi:hypothetical protein